MKSEIVEGQVGFQPVTISITFESQQELDALGTITNYSSLVDSAKKQWGVDISRLTDIFIEAGADVHKTSDLHELVKVRVR